MLRRPRLTRHDSPGIAPGINDTHHVVGILPAVVRFPGFLWLSQIQLCGFPSSVHFASPAPNPYLVELSAVICSSVPLELLYTYVFSIVNTKRLFLGVMRPKEFQMNLKNNQKIPPKRDR
jgi:hypothetical protein